MFLAHFDIPVNFNCTEQRQHGICLFYLMKKQKNAFGLLLIDHNYMKEAIKMQVEFSLLYETLLIVEMRSKMFKAKGAQCKF